MKKYTIGYMDLLKDKKESKAMIFFASATVITLLACVYVLAIMFGGR